MIKKYMLIHRIKKNRKKFFDLEKNILLEKNSDIKQQLACEAALFAASHSIGIYNSSIIESVFLDMAKEIDAELTSSPLPGSVLHVMTKAWFSGGHTRCVERWIKICKDKKHSCVLLDQPNNLYGSLKSIVEEHGGELTCFDLDLSLKEKAKLLRSYASQFETVILHVHMYDPTPIAAFGVPEFLRPVIFFNHADHCFWLGCSIADYVADITLYGHQITQYRRGINRAMCLGIPSENLKNFDVNYLSARSFLGFRENDKIIFSSGQADKFAPIGFPSYYNIISDILTKEKNAKFIIVGINAKEFFWSKLKKIFSNRLILKSYVDFYSEYLPYLAASDLVLDSYPVGGGTFLIDAVAAHKPILSLGKFQTDFILKSPAHCEKYEQFLDKAHKILNDNNYAKQHINKVFQQYLDEADQTQWKSRFEHLLSLVHVHDIYPVTDGDRNKIDAISIQFARWIEPVDSYWKQVQKIRKFCISVHTKKNSLEVTILGKKIIDFRKK